MPAAARWVRRRPLTAAAALAAMLATSSATAAYAGKPDPSGKSAHGKPAVTAASHRLQVAKQKALADKRQLARAGAQVAAAQQQLTTLAATATKAVTRYRSVLIRLRHARAVATAAQAASSAATAQATTQQRQVDAFVRAAYMSGGPMATFAIALSARGPAAILDDASLLNAVSHSQTDMVEQLDLARRTQAAAAAVARSAMADVARLFASADAERRTALMAMANQHALIGTLSAEQVTVAKTLAADESHVARAARERAAAGVRAQLAAQRAALVAAWSDLQAAGEAMPWATAAQGRKVVALARKQLGLPYSWAGGDDAGPTLGAVNEQGNPAGLHTVGFDCSGLALFAWAHVGFTLDHYTGYQWVEGHHIPLENLRPGDLVFFARDTSNPLTIHHVGIYVGHGKMIDAPHTGAVVRYDDVFVPGLIGAVRP